MAADPAGLGDQLDETMRVVDARRHDPEDKHAHEVGESDRDDHRKHGHVGEIDLSVAAIERNTAEYAGTLSD